MKTKEQLSVWGRFAANVIVSVIVTAILQQLLKLDVYQGIILCTTLLLAILVMQIDIKNSRASSLIENIFAQSAVWTDTSENVKRLKMTQRSLEVFSTTLQRISDGLRVITERHSSGNGMFVDWYENRLDELCKHIGHTIETDSFHFDTSLLREGDKIYNAFKGRPTDYFWATSTCEGIAWYLTTSGDIFLRAIDAKFSSGMIPSLRRLFSYESEGELAEFNTQLCFYLHKQSGYEYRIISRDDFESIIRGFGDRTLVPDFGIYGTHFVWETPTELQVYIRYGEFCVDKARIAKYKKLFETLWLQGADYQVSNKEIETKYKGCRMDSFRRLALSADVAGRVPDLGENNLLPGSIAS